MERVFGKILLILNGVTCSCVSIFTCNVFVRVCMPESTKCAVHTTTARRFFVPCPSQIDRVFTDFRCRKADTWYSDSINYWIIDYTRRKLGIWLDFLTKWWWYKKYKLTNLNMWNCHVDDDIDCITSFDCLGCLFGFRTSIQLHEMHGTWKHDRIIFVVDQKNGETATTSSSHIHIYFIICHDFEWWRFVNESICKKRPQVSFTYPPFTDQLIMIKD